jgi:ubiquinone/menaquinone biosynthesis C-methylase UbiE
MSHLQKEKNIDQHVCPWWLAYTFDNRLRRLIHQPQKMFTPFLMAGDVALDLGCGMGVNSIAMAQIVGDAGKALAVDVQQKMLDILMQRAHKKDVAHRIQPHRCLPDRIGLDIKADFVLTFWMVHETPNPLNLIQQIYELVKPGGKFLVVEPRLHVTEAQYQEVLARAQQLGFQLLCEPRIWLSRAAALVKL